MNETQESKQPTTPETAETATETASNILAPGTVISIRPRVGRPPARRGQRGPKKGTVQFRKITSDLAEVVGTYRRRVTQLVNSLDTSLPGLHESVGEQPYFLASTMRGNDISLSAILRVARILHVPFRWLLGEGDGDKVELIDTSKTRLFRRFCKRGPHASSDPASDAEAEKDENT